tara:strand:- start:94 stop:276 length:183 start_codon:yes stop_codon:yes gene_type:complete
MQITKKRLKQIIKEELDTLSLTEQDLSDRGTAALSAILSLDEPERIRILAMIRAGQTLEN